MNDTQLVEVWGDTVDIRHLAWSVVLGVVISLGAFAVAGRVLAAYVHDPTMARAYAMLVGLGGCLLAGGVCAKLFKPKRDVIEQATGAAGREAVLAQLAAEAGGLGRVADLPPAVAAEMKELELYDLFARYERDTRDRRGALAAQTDASLPDADSEGAR
ncbi:MULTISPECIES: hypothetical protein [Paraburkholderia]|uniref:hypothetical protein n=1 Tax=Paraburkholderia TaxID=1822464 RepID=UPI00225ABE48|nr:MULTISPECIES: hypothetical protein [Paraburkholderia]MCX4161043.1 hypothetical protein [Paraburkholderia megapolitana]MDN7156539.1 hypothetical protein [Paraburkholderia sp. CHISQ3]MDQ6493584.1 hypothetical protein [Paraburkholderia megapolitana]